MFKYFLILIFFTLLSNTQASNKEKIIENLQNTVSLNFQFEQNINGKVENGNCTIKYPKKIYCKYQKKNNSKKKGIIFVSAHYGNWELGPIIIKKLNLEPLSLYNLKSPS